jgi:PhnB protein
MARSKKDRKVRRVPKGYATVTPSFGVPGCLRAIAFLKDVFGAKVRELYQSPDGRVAHAEVEVGDSRVMCGEPATAEESWSLHAMIYVKNCDKVFARAVEAGATVKEPLADRFYGDRNGRVVDPFGNEWVIATHIEDVSGKEMKRRAAEMHAAPVEE